jgi:hypothetical protein
MSVDTMPDAERVRSAILQVALAAYEDALVQGLCAEGAWETAVAAMRRFDLGSVFEKERSQQAHTREAS